MKNKMEHLRNHLFEVIEKLQDPDEDFCIDKAKAINNAAGQIISSAKVEVQYLALLERAGFAPITDSALLQLEKEKDKTGRPGESG